MQTPSGAIAEILAIYPLSGEALVFWQSGETARFRLKLLKHQSKGSA